MKKILTTLLVFLLSLTSINTAIYAEDKQDDSLARVEETGKLVIAASGTLYPIAFYNEDNELVGYTLDILKEVTKNMGLELEVKEMGVDGMMTSLDNGQVDLIAEGFDMTPERQADYLFSTPLIYSLGTAVVRSEDNSGIESVEDFAGKKAGGAASTTYMRTAQKLGAEPVVYDNSSNEQYLMDLVAKRIDFIPNDYYTIKSAIAFYGDQYPIKMADIFYNPTQAGFMYHKGAEELVKKINEEIEKLRESGRLQEIAEQYFNGENPSEPFKEINGTPIEDIPVIEY
ncbi:transporter substrate-binding domain-containing protein [Facklamia hominis]|uniref:Solute-binding protein family 3/N-terminal domain-containing protein n=1 Tax=Facklamia hominis CCUG 36813 TaxID=883111 RepID=K1LR29_9LACT|nr:transporter substrate-binding domain-containing protein [Facklamia hominis]EKB54572.1 hypothetical protein HMPREF9706_00762 [Facklamia hominis CCUG 36813]EPH11991.1 hypothetical protein HMPREF9260_00753 [Facklamia hominis ACS-120-V-Sch10]